MNSEKLKKLYLTLQETALWEMANLKKSRTGLPVMIYISGNKSSRGPRIKFFDSYSDTLGDNYDLLIPLTVSKDPQIPIEHELNIKKQDLDKVKQWVIKNYDLLLALYNEEIDEIEAALKQQKI